MPFDDGDLPRIPYVAQTSAEQLFMDALLDKTVFATRRTPYTIPDKDGNDSEYEAHFGRRSDAQWTAEGKLEAYLHVERKSSADGYNVWDLRSNFLDYPVSFWIVIYDGTKVEIWCSLPENPWSAFLDHEYRWGDYKVLAPLEYKAGFLLDQEKYKKNQQQSS